MKIRKSYYVDENIVGGLARVASALGVPESYVVEKYLSSGLGNEEEMTAAERYHFLRDGIEKSLDNTLRLCNITEHKGSLSEKFATCLKEIHMNSVLSSRKYRNGIAEISLFEILNKILELDKELFDKIYVQMGKLGKMRYRYTQMYPKKILSDKVQSRDNINNNTSTVSTTSEISDGEYLRKYRR